MALNRSDKSRILRRYFPGMTCNSEMSTEPSQVASIPSDMPEQNQDAGQEAPLRQKSSCRGEQKAAEQTYLCSEERRHIKVVGSPTTD